MDSGEKDILTARLKDAVRMSDMRNVPKFVGFLDSSGVALASAVAKNEKARWRLFGGYEDAERVYFGVFPDWCEYDDSAYPIKKLRIINRSSRALEHREVLGTLMSLGIERDTVGDILPDDRDVVLFVSETVAEFIVSQVTKIASCGVDITVDDTDYMPTPKGFTEFSDTVASTRVDAVVSAIANCSRSTALELLSAGFVAVNGLEVQKASKEITEGDTVTVRKKGRFIIDSVSEHSKKGRIILKYRKYN